MLSYFHHCPPPHCTKPLLFKLLLLLCSTGCVCSTCICIIDIACGRMRCCCCCCYRGRSNSIITCVCAVSDNTARLVQMSCLCLSSHNLPRRCISLILHLLFFPPLPSCTTPSNLDTSPPSDGNLKLVFDYPLQASSTLFINKMG